MTTTLANQLTRINLANGGSMQSAQVVTLQTAQQNASSSLMIVRDQRSSMCATRF
jgi:hypothetical protein